VPQQVYLGTVKPEEVNYPTLLAILRTNGMAANTIEGRVNIVPLFEIPLVRGTARAKRRLEHPGGRMGVARPHDQ
jgi:hypothetical protein